jgi:hypothetical protein
MPGITMRVRRTFERLVDQRLALLEVFHRLRGVGDHFAQRAVEHLHQARHRLRVAFDQLLRHEQRVAVIVDAVVGHRMVTMSSGLTPRFSRSIGIERKPEMISQIAVDQHGGAQRRRRGHPLHPSRGSMLAALARSGQMRRLKPVGDSHEHAGPGNP